jgi:hypothetical protein
MDAMFGGHSTSFRLGITIVKPDKYFTERQQGHQDHQKSR